MWINEKEGNIVNIKYTNRSDDMSKSLIYLLITIILIAGGASDALAQNIKLDRSVMGSGGMVNEKNSANWKISGIVGQIAIEKISGTFEGKPLNVYQGFWVPVGDVTNVEEENQLNSQAFSSELTNYPNPVSTSTTFRYDLPGTSQVSLKVYDVVGHLVKVIFDGIQDQGSHEFPWNLKGDNNVELGSGSYMYELTVRPAQVAGSASFQAFNLRNILVIVK